MERRWVIRGATSNVAEVPWAAMHLVKVLYAYVAGNNLVHHADHIINRAVEEYITRILYSSLAADRLVIRGRRWCLYKDTWHAFHLKWVADFLAFPP